MTDNELKPRADFGFSVKGWRRRGNFFHAIEPKFVGALPSDARERSGKDTIILAPGNRVKMWLEYSMDGKSLAWLRHTDVSDGTTLKPLDDVVCDGVVERVNGLHEAYLDSETWYRVLRNKADDPDEDDEQLAPIDACIEGVFDPDDTDERGYLIGRFDDLPPWMGDDVEVSIAPPDSDTGAYIKLPEVPRNEVPPWLRVNGEWMALLPIYYKPGEYLLNADPVDIAAARNYDGSPLPNDETLPIRLRSQIRPLFMKIVPRFGYVRPTKDEGDDYIAWRTAATTIEYALFGLGQTHRQARYYRTRQRESEDAAVAKWRLSQKRYDKRSEAYNSYTFEKWLEETGDKYAKKWVYESKLAGESATTCKARAEYLEKALDAKRAEVEEAEQVVSLLEAKYESFIRTMYLRR